MSTTTPDVAAILELEHQLQVARQLHKQEQERQAKLAGHLHPEAQPLEALKLTEVKASPMPATRDVPGVAIYLRISDDREGAGLGVERQLADIRPMIPAGQLVHLYVDNSLTASGKRRRPAYEQLVKDMEAGKVQLLLAWHTDRLHRNLAELEDFMDAAQAVAIQTAKGGLLDLATPTGRLLARLLGAIARYELEHMGERQKAKQLQLAQQGMPSGTPRCFGYTQGYRIDPETGSCVVEAEALALQQVVAQVLAGASLRSQVAWLAEQGHKGTRGSAITQTALRALLLRPTIAGLRVYHHGQDDEQTFDAVWPGIITVEQHEALKGLLNARKRRPGHNARKHLLTGISRCGVCGSPMAAASERSHKPGQRYGVYRCRASFCINRSADRLEELVLAIVGARLARSDARGLLVDPQTDAVLQHLAAKAKEAQRKLDRLLADYDAELLTGAEYKPRRDKLHQELAALEQERMLHVQPTHVLEGLAGAEDAQALLEAMPLSRQRAVIQALGVPVIHKGYRQQADHEVVTMDWHKRAA